MTTNTTQTVDERCAKLARWGVDNSLCAKECREAGMTIRYRHYAKMARWCADRIIALRAADLAQRDAQEVQS